MVNSDSELKMSDKEVLYEEIHNRREDLSLDHPNIHGKTKDDSKGGNNMRFSAGMLTRDNEDNFALSEDVEDLYEVIPAHFAPQNTVKKPPFIANDSQKVSSHESTGLQCTLDGHRTEYAEIVMASKVTEIRPSRPTRESDNPILREDFSGNLSFLPNLRDVRKELSLHSQKRLLDGDKRLPKSSPDISRKPEVFHDSPNTSPKLSPQHSPRTPHTTAFYVNLEFPLIESDRESSRRSSVSSTAEKQSLSSFENEMSSPEYENVKNRADLDFDMTRPATSLPMNIVYSDLDFKQTSNDSQGRCASSPGMLSRFIERSKSLSPGESPRLPGRDHPLRSVSLNTAKPLNSGALGNFMARFVGKAAVQRSNDKTLRTTMDEITDKAKPENCVSVIAEIDLDKMRISTNCEPWELIASFRLEDIGCACVCEDDNTVFGVLVSVPGSEAACYVLRCPNAEAIHRVLTDSFKATNSKVKLISIVCFCVLLFVGVIRVMLISLLQILRDEFIILSVFQYKQPFINGIYRTKSYYTRGLLSTESLWFVLFLYLFWQPLLSLPYATFAVL